MAAVKVKASSPLSSFSSFHFSSLSGSRSLTPPRFHLISAKIPFFYGPLRSRLVSVCCQNPNSDSVIVDQTVPGYDTGSKGQARFPDDHGQTSASSPSSAIDFLTLRHRLKTTKRKGWINHGIKCPESIADHMFRMALMALIVGDFWCIKIAIVHGIAEAIVGDITPSDGVPKAEKSRWAQAALKQMCEILGGVRAEEIKELWEEYENNSSLEANLVKDFDKVEMILQALEYELEHGKMLDEF